MLSFYIWINSLLSPVTAPEPFSLQERLQVTPKSVLLIHIVVAFVPRQLQLKHIPSFNVRGYFHVSKIEVKASDSCEKLALVKFGAGSLAWFPTFELPVMPWDHNSHHASPSGIREWCYIVVDVKCDFFSVYLAFNLNRLGSVSWVFRILTFLKELLDVAEAKTSRGKALRHDNDGVWRLLKLLS